VEVAIELLGHEDQEERQPVDHVEAKVGVRGDEIP